MNERAKDFKKLWEEIGSGGSEQKEFARRFYNLGVLHEKRKAIKAIDAATRELTQL